MAAIKYLDLTGLQMYDAKIKTFISTGDAKALKNFTYDEATRTLKFYKAETVTAETVADFTMTLPADVDVSNFIEKMTGATEGHVVVANADGTVKDGGVALADLATKSEVEAAQKAGDDAQSEVDALEELVADMYTNEQIDKAISDAQTAATYDDTDVKAGIKENKEAIELLNGASTTEGSVDYKIAQAVAAIMENPDDTMNSINELVTWINDHAEDALELSNKVSANEGAIADLEALVGEEGVAKQIEDAIAEALTIEGADKYALASDLVDAIARVATLEGKAHTHTFDEEVLNGITSEKVSAWDASEQNAKDYADGLAVNYDAAGSANAAETNAKTYADGLNTAMNTRVESLEGLVGEGMVAISEAEINGMFTA